MPIPSPCIVTRNDFFISTSKHAEYIFQVIPCILRLAINYDFQGSVLK